MKIYLANIMDIGKVSLFEVSIGETSDPVKSPLNDVRKIKKMLREIVKVCELTIIKTSTHKFEPYGITSFFLLSESHVSIHTWPEMGACAIDVYSCRYDYPVDKIEEIIKKHLKTEKVNTSIHRRIS